MQRVRVDFYLLADQTPSAFWLLACRLLAKAYKYKQQVLVYCKDENEAYQLDDLLWTYEPNSFIPHCIQNADIADLSPIHIGWEKSELNKDLFSANIKDSDARNEMSENSNTKVSLVMNEISAEKIDPVKASTLFKETNQEVQRQSNRILFNLSSGIPSFYSQFHRVVELIANDEKAKTESRHRYTTYRAQQCELYFHQLS